MQTLQEGKLNFLCIGLFIAGFAAEEVFSTKRFYFLHALFALIFWSKHMINVHFRRLINICVRREKRLASSRHAKQARKQHRKTSKI